MPEILFIAEAECVLALIEDLQAQLETKIHLESDYACGEERVYHVRPLAVFLQGKIGEETCDSLTDQAKIILHGQAVPLILLSDDVGIPYDQDQYDACFDLGLPLEELSRQVRQLLDTLPKIAWKDAFAEAQELGTSIDTGLSAIGPAIHDAGTFQSIEAIDPALFDVPPYDFDPTAQIQVDPTAQMEADPTAQIEADPTAQMETDPVAQIELVELQDEVVFPVEPTTDPLASDPSPVPGPPHEDPPRPSPVHKTSRPPGPASVLRPEPASQPGADAQSGPSDSPAVSTPNPAQQAMIRAATVKPAASRVITPRRDSADAHQVLEESESLPYRKAILWGLALLLLVVCIASIQIYVRRDPVAVSPDSNRSRLASAGQPTAPVSASPAPSKMPKFLPQVAPDPQYAVGHPGWERYLAGGLEYLVYREEGQVKAIQILGGAGGEITIPFLKECIRDCTGQEQFTIEKTELREGFQVASGALHKDGRFIIYREIKGGQIRGVVLIFPAGFGTAPE